MSTQSSITSTSNAEYAVPRSTGPAKALMIVAGILSVAVLLQLFFAGFAVFTAPASADRAEWGLHAWNGRVVLPLLAILAGLLAVLARAPRRLIGLAFLPLAGIAFQTILFVLTGLLTGSNPDKTNTAGSLMLGLHPVNGVLVLALSILLVIRARQFARGRYPVTAHPMT